jgi:hypothetical protein
MHHAVVYAQILDPATLPDLLILWTASFVATKLLDWRAAKHAADKPSTHARPRVAFSG